MSEATKRYEYCAFSAPTKRYEYCAFSAHRFAPLRAIRTDVSLLRSLELTCSKVSEKLPTPLGWGGGGEGGGNRSWLEKLSIWRHISHPPLVLTSIASIK